MIWEIRIKEAIGKVEIPSDFDVVLDAESFLELPVSIRHAHEVARLPMIHRDPFDRMLVAQASLEKRTFRHPRSFDSGVRS